MSYNYIVITHKKSVKLRGDKHMYAQCWRPKQNGYIDT